jgi:hypothetical protein
MNSEQREINRIIYEGGLQKSQPKDEALIYYMNLLDDSVKFCLKDFKSKEPSADEKSCLKGYLTKNFQLLNGISANKI